jgi:hypothetical protein
VAIKLGKVGFWVLGSAILGVGKIWCVRKKMALARIFKISVDKTEFHVWARAMANGRIPEAPLRLFP